MNENYELKYGRITYFEPNQTINQEDLTKHVNLYVTVPSRYYDSNEQGYDSILSGCEIKSSNNKKFRLLTDSYSDVTYSSFENDLETNNNELFGVESIDISFDSQFFPTVTILFNDVKGYGLMSTMEYDLATSHSGDKKKAISAKAFFKSLFNFPYPKFTLEIKGYLGSTRKYTLNLLEFNSEFDSLTGDFKTTVKFIGDMYGLLGDIPMSYLLIAPFLGVDKDKINNYWDNSDDICTFITFLNKYAAVCSGTFTSGTVDANTISDLNDVRNKITYLKLLRDKLTDIIESARISVNTVTSTVPSIVNEENKIPATVSTGDGDALFLVEPTAISEYGKMNEKLNELKTRYNGIPNEFIEEITGSLSLVSGSTTGEHTYQVFIFKNIKTVKDDIGTRLAELSESFDEQYFSDELNKLIYDTLGFKPTIKNLYLMVIKHLECFMKYFYDKIKITKTYPTISGNDIITIDNVDGSKLAPFTAFYNKIDEKYVYPLDSGLLNNINNFVEDKIVSDIVNASDLTYDNAENLIDQIETFNEQNRQNNNGVFKSTFIGDYINSHESYYAYSQVFKERTLSINERIELIYKIFLRRVKAFYQFYPNNVESDDYNMDKFISNEVENLLNFNFFSDDVIAKIINYNVSTQLITNVINDDIIIDDNGYYFTRFGEHGITTSVDDMLLIEKNSTESNHYYLDGNLDVDYFEDNASVYYKGSHDYFERSNYPMDNIGEYLSVKKFGKTPYSFGRFGRIGLNIDKLNYLAKSFTCYAKADGTSDTMETYQTGGGAYADAHYGIKIDKLSILTIGEYVFLNNNKGDDSMKIMVPIIEGRAMNRAGMKSICFATDITLNAMLEWFCYFFYIMHLYTYKNNTRIEHLFNNVTAYVQESHPNYTIKQYLEETYRYKGDFTSDGDINIFINCSQQTITADKINNYLAQFKTKIETKTNVSRVQTLELNRNEQFKENAINELKKGVYYNLKNINDRWLCTLNAGYFGLQNNVRCLTPTFNNNDECVCDIDLFYKLIKNIITTNKNISVIEFLTKLGQDNGLLFLIQPYVGEENVKDSFKPQRYLPTEEKLPIFIYISQCNPSHNVNIENNEIPDDGFSLTDFENKNNFSKEAMAEFIINQHDYNVEAFGVTYGMQNQNIFRTVNINTLNPNVTEHSISNIISISNQGEESANSLTVLNNINLYPVFNNRSYNCTVTMMGCANIQPLMYFQLNNIPMFKGAYLIYDVKHLITNNDFVTTFTGVRVSKYKIPIESRVINISNFNQISRSDGTDNSNTDNSNTDKTNSNEPVESRNVTYQLNGDTTFKSVSTDESEWTPYNDPQCGSKGCWHSAVRSARKILKRTETCVGENGVGTNDIGSAANVVQLLYEKHDHERRYNDNGDYNLYYEETGNNRVDKYKYCVEYMKNEIGHSTDPAPVIVGVAHSVKRWNSESGKWLNEGITDHFLCVYAYAEQEGKVFFKYFESGRNGPGDCVNNRNMLVYDPNEGNPLFVNMNSTRNKDKIEHRRYDVSQIRIYGEHKDRLNSSIIVGAQKKYNEFTGDKVMVNRGASNRYNSQN